MAKKILVVDDEEWARVSLCRLFEEKGYTVTEAANGVEALKEVKRQMPDFIILDQEMPRMGGFEVLKKLQADPKTENIPVVMTHTDVGEDTRPLGSSCWGYSLRPFNPHGVMTFVERIIQSLTDES